MDIYIIILILSYSVGSLPFGLILSRLGGLGDIRKIGSGNIGATNVFRKSKALALLTLFLDSTKGFIAVALANSYVPDKTFVFISALFSIIGHIFPVWLLFKGGKGVATLLGSLVFIEYKLAICFLLSWIVIFTGFKYASLSSIISTAFILLIICMHYEKDVSMVFLIISLLIIAQHINNIIRIIQGNENRVNIKL
ncbi:glycerol-3-phosphate 1-O-acyltransferase PlsY [Ehrlichia sp. JZT12]